MDIQLCIQVYLISTHPLKDIGKNTFDKYLPI